LKKKAEKKKIKELKVTFAPSGVSQSGFDGCVSPWRLPESSATQHLNPLKHLALESSTLLWVYEGK